MVSVLSLHLQNPVFDKTCRKVGQSQWYRDRVLNQLACLPLWSSSAPSLLAIAESHSFCLLSSRSTCCILPHTQIDVIVKICWYTKYVIFGWLCKWMTNHLWRWYFYSNNYKELEHVNLVRNGYLTQTWCLAEHDCSLGLLGWVVIQTTTVNQYSTELCCQSSKKHF